MFLRGFCLLSAACLLFVNAAFGQSIQVQRFLENNEGAIIKTADGPGSHLSEAAVESVFSGA